MEKYVHLAVSRNGKNVFWDPIHSHAATHFGDKPGLIDIVVEVLSAKNLDGDEVGFDIDMGREIGVSDVVEVNENDEIIYALRKNRTDQGLVPFVKNRKAQPDTYVSISLIKHSDNTYILSSAWIGKWDDPPFPTEKHATPESPDYWSKHAFILGSQEIQPGSKTSIKPW